jgi:NTE family protein
MSSSSPCIVIAGGAVRGLGMLGSLQYIDELYDLNKVHEYFGTSVGSILSYLLCIGYKPLEIIHHVIGSNILKNIRNGISISTITKHQGLFSFDSIRDELEILTLSKFDKLFTMKSLFEKQKKELGCVTFNYTKNQMELLHHTTTPDLDCLIAIQMSCSIPFVFNKCLVNGMVYIDGGLIDNFPIRSALKLGKTNIIGIVSLSNTTQFIEENGTELEISKIISLPMTEKTKKTIRKFKKKYTIIDIPLSQDVLNFDLDVSDIMDMFSQGYKVGRSTFEEDL